MIRSMFIACLALALSGCWVSEKRLFGPGDWAQPAGLSGNFVIETAQGEEDGTLVLKPRPDGMIEGTATRKDKPKPETSAVGFVAIPGGSGVYFLMVQQFDPGKGGEIYLVGRWEGGALVAYWPECKGTPDIAGMLRDKVEYVNESVCGFTSKQAVLEVALLAERELKVTRIFAPQKLGRLRKVDSEDSSEADKAEPVEDTPG